MKLYKPDNFAQYKKANTCKSNIEIKSDPKKHWVLEETADAIVQYIGKNIQKPTFGICHGVRNGTEVSFFRNKLNIEIIGTEISEWIANQFEHVIAWDFHEIKKEWIGNVDFIYSNSLDHSYDPKHCVEQWMRCLKLKGLCFIEWTPWHNDGHCSPAECFSASKEEYQTMFANFCKLQDVLELFNPQLHEKRQKTTIFVLSNK
jgi:hypothetical protein